MIKFLSRDKGGVVAVDIGSSSVKILNLKMDAGAFILKSYAIIPLRDAGIFDNALNKEELVQKIDVVLENNKITDTRAVFAIPKKMAISRDVTLNPELTDQEIDQYVMDNASSNYLPSHISEYHWDVGLKGNSLTEAIFVAAKNETIQSKATILESLGLQPKFSFVDTHTYTQLIPLLFSNKNLDEPALFIVAGNGHSIIVIVDKGIPIYSGSIEIGGAKLNKKIISEKNFSYSEAEQWKLNESISLSTLDQDILNSFFGEFLSEIVSFVRFSKKMEMSDFKKVFLTGGTSRLKGLKEYLEKELGIDVFRVQTQNIVQLSPNIDIDAYSQDQDFLLPALSYAISSYYPALNLMPWRDERYQNRKNQFVLFSILALVLGLATGFMVRSYYSTDLDRNNEANNLVLQVTKETESSLDKLKDISTKRDNMLTRMDLIQALQGQRHIVVDVIKAIVDSVPDQSYLTSIKKQDAQIIFEGRAFDSSVVADFIRSLKKTGWFGEVSMNSYISYNEMIKNDASLNLKNNSPEVSYGQFKVTAVIPTKKNTNPDLTPSDNSSTEANTGAISNNQEGAVETGIPSPFKSPQRLHPQQPSQVNTSENQVGTANEVGNV